MIPLDRPLVITDTETTGLSPVRNRIIEIGAIRLQDDQEPISFSQLVDPGESIPYRITRLTGITSSMVYGCPDAAEVIPAFADFLGDGVLVAHNLKFDKGFIDAERARLGLEPMQNVGLCTARLARRLLPGLRSKSLGSLSRFFRIAAHGRHRALRDVEITAEVLKRLIDIAAREHHVQTLDELLEMQSKTYARINSFSKHILEIKRDLLPELPEQPGIYRMLDRSGRVLYVGKAKSLSRRVKSYFNAIEAHTPRIRELVGKLRSLNWTTTNTELEALLLESRLIQELNPPFNRAQKRTTPRPFLRIDVRAPFPRVVANVFPKNDGAEYYGPLRSRSEAKAILDIIERFFRVRTCDDRELQGGRRCLRADIGRCDAPCEQMVTPDGYAETMDGVRNFLAGDVLPVISKLESEMASASAELAFEEAARLRDLISVIDDRTARNGSLASRISDDDAVILHASPDGDVREVLIIRSGRFIESVAGFDLRDPSSFSLVTDRIASVFSTADKADSESLQGGANEIRVLLHRVYANRENVLRLNRDMESDLLAFCDHVADQAHRFFDPVQELEQATGTDDRLAVDG